MALTVQVPESQIPAQDLYPNSYNPNPKYSIVVYLNPLVGSLLKIPAEALRIFWVGIREFYSDAFETLASEIPRFNDSQLRVGNLV